MVTEAFEGVDLLPVACQICVLTDVFINRNGDNKDTTLSPIILFVFLHSSTVSVVFDRSTINQETDKYIYRNPSICGPRRLHGRAEKKSHVDRPINKAIFGPHLEPPVQNYTYNSYYQVPASLRALFKFASNGQTRALKTEEPQISSPPLNFHADIQYNKTQTCRSSEYIYPRPPYINLPSNNTLQRPHNSSRHPPSRRSSSRGRSGRRSPSSTDTRLPNHQGQESVDRAGGCDQRRRAAEQRGEDGTEVQEGAEKGEVRCAEARVEFAC
jgi:hypothetical protein